MPMPSDGQVGTHLILRPAESLLDLFIALLDPHTEPVEADDFGHGRGRMWTLGGSPWRGKIRHEVPRRRFRHGRRVRTGNHQTLRFLSAIRAAFGFQRPPAFRMPIAKSPQERLPVAGLCHLPRSGLGEFVRTPQGTFRMPPSMGGFLSEDIGNL